MQQKNRPVYSTDGHTVNDRRVQRCSDCQRPLAGCVCKDRATKHRGSGDGIVRISRDRKQRGGKTVTVVAGLQGSDEQLAEVAGRLKRLCGSGGTVKNRTIEVQGDHRERIAEALRGMGFTVRLAGG
ncbi:MAG TPA: stress response translation initiation inhibitor YciH [Dehalococcoidia bacterium]